jgi:hypothetical protein
MGKQQVCMKPKETTMVQRAVARIVILLLSLLAVPLVAHPQAPRKIHIPPDLVVDQGAFDGESSSHRPYLLQDDVWTMLCHRISEKITLALSIAWHFTTKSGGIWKFLTISQSVCFRDTGLSHIFIPLTS